MADRKGARYDASIIDAGTPMYYKEFEPDPRLKPWIAAYWNFRVEPEGGVIDHWIPPTGGVMLAFPRGGPASLIGPRIEPLGRRVRSGDVVRGAHFWPGAAVSLLGPTIPDLSGEQRLAGEVLDEAWLGPIERELAQANDQDSARQLLDRSLAKLVGGAGPLDDLVMTAVFKLIATHGNQPLVKVAQSVDLSPRQFRRRFRAAAGVSPKEFARLQRVRSLAIDAVGASEENWAKIAAERGYADQAHLVREFRRILGLTPTAFGHHAQRIRHDGILR